jgi:hypothetical protein
MHSCAWKAGPMTNFYVDAMVIVIGVLKHCESVLMRIPYFSVVFEPSDRWLWIALDYAVGNNFVAKFLVNLIVVEPDVWWNYINIKNFEILDSVGSSRMNSRTVDIDCYRFAERRRNTIFRHALYFRTCAPVHKQMQCF